MTSRKPPVHRTDGMRAAETVSHLLDCARCDDARVRDLTAEYAADASFHARIAELKLQRWLKEFLDRPAIFEGKS